MGNAWGDDMMEFDAKVEHTTEKAWLIYDNMSGYQAWLPKSAGEMVSDGPDEDGNTIFRAPRRWLKHVKFIV